MLLSLILLFRLVTFFLPRKWQNCIKNLVPCQIYTNPYLLIPTGETDIQLHEMKTLSVTRIVWIAGKQSGLAEIPCKRLGRYRQWYTACIDIIGLSNSEWMQIVHYTPWSGWHSSIDFQFSMWSRLSERFLPLHAVFMVTQQYLSFNASCCEEIISISYVYHTPAFLDDLPIIVEVYKMVQYILVLLSFTQILIIGEHFIIGTTKTFWSVCLKSLSNQYLKQKM